MRKLRLLIIPFLIGAFFIAGCKKNTVDENYTPIINPVIPDFATRVNASVHGFITNEAGEAVQGATVTAGAATTTTDGFGYFKISNTMFAKSAGFIQVTQAGYFTGYKSFLPIQDKEIFTRLQLVPKTNNGAFDADAGGAVSIAGGATVTLPANAVVTAATNTPYSGTVTVSAHWFDPSDMQTTSLTMPGDLTGVDSAGHLNVLQTFGMLAVELTGSSGELLQIAAGKKASLSFPLPAALQSTAPAYIPLWYFDETKGVWMQEGHAVKSGNSYKGEVSHFSYWNADSPFTDLTDITFQLVNTQLQPLANVAVEIEGSGLYYRRIAYTNASGFIYGKAPRHAGNYNLNVITDCGEKVFVTNFDPRANTDLGTVVANITQYSGSFQAAVIKCNNTPVTDGDIIMIAPGYSRVFPVQNGVVNSATTICPNTAVEFFAIDRETSQQSNAQNITLMTGSNDLGNLTACTPQTEYINCTLDGSATNFTLPQYMFNGNFFFANDSTEIKAVDLLNSGITVFRIGAAILDAPGLYPIGWVELNGVYYLFLNPTNITISNYGLIGGFINGSVSGQVRNMNTNTVHNLECDFQVKRDQ